MTEATTALIQVAPDQDTRIQALFNESLDLQRYAEARIILIDDDLKSATDDLAIIAGLRKSIEEKRKEYTSPIREHLDVINEAFKAFTLPLIEADTINRDKVKAYRVEQERIIQEAQDIEAKKMELAKREMELKGEISVDLSPVPAPPPLPNQVRTDLGSTSVVKNRKYRVVDFALLPDQYKIENSVLLGRVVKSGIPEIPGVEIYTEDSLRVTATKVR